MDESPTTRLSLLVRIRDSNDSQAWGQFVKIYSPLVYRYARRHGLQDADAADVTQNVLQTVARSVSRFEYDPRRGSFRGWLFSLARARVCDFLAERARHAQGTGDTGVLSFLENQASREPEEASWEREYRTCVFDWAVAETRGHFRDSTWQAFWQTSIKGKDSHEVAELLEMTVEAVYLARSRVLARLKQTIRRVEDGGEEK